MKRPGLYLLAIASLLQAGHGLAATLYVDVNSAKPAPPYASWGTAAQTIQDAVDVAAGGDTIIVGPGDYFSGSRVSGDGTTNRVVINKPVVVQSLFGASLTAIRGLNLMRCAYLTNDAVLTGFTLHYGRAANGGALWCESTNALIRDCTLISSSATYGAGAWSGTLSNCTLTGNKVLSPGNGGGAYNSFLINCTLSGNTTETNGGGGAGASGCTLIGCLLTNNLCNGNGATVGGGISGCTALNCTITGNRVTGAGSTGGGARNSILNNCTLSNNRADYTGGGASNCTLTNCTLTGNYASVGGGGAIGGTLVNCVLRGNEGYGDGGGAFWNATLYNCTLVGNLAQNGGGAFGCTLYNCIIYHNTAINGSNNYSGSFNYCCTPDLGGIGNITNAPLFVNETGGDLHLQTYSPCVNAGTNSYAGAAVDRDGNPRIVGGTVDIGAYEEPTATTASGLPAVPANVVASLQGGQAGLTWNPAARASSYNVKRAPASGGAYTNLATGLTSTNYIDSTVVNGGKYFYVITAVNAYGESLFSQWAGVYVVDHFSCTPISSPQTCAVPFSVTISACALNGLVLSNFNGAAILTAAGDHGPAMVSPAVTPAFTNGRWSGSVTILAGYPDTNLRLICSSNGAAGLSNPFNVVAPTNQVLGIKAGGLLFNPFAQRIYVTGAATSPVHSNRLVVIDPALGRIEATYLLGDDPSRMALSDDGQFLYLGCNGSNVFRRFNLESNLVDLVVSLGTSPFSGRKYYALDLAVLPGNPHSVVVGECPPNDVSRIIIFDDDVPRSQTLEIPLDPGTVVAVSSHRVYAGSPFVRMNVNASGIGGWDFQNGLMNDGEFLKYQGGLIFTPSGKVFNPETLVVSGSLPACTVVEPDLAAGRIFTLASPSANAWSLYACNSTNLQAVGSQSLSGVLGTPSSLIRWGAKGIAFSTSQNQVYLFQSDLVPTVRPVMAAGNRQASGSFEVRFTGDPCAPYSIWASTNLIDWSLLGAANPSTNGWFRFLDLNATNLPRCFYRAATP
jgi:hypothetical protein